MEKILGFYPGIIIEIQIYRRNLMRKLFIYRPVIAACAFVALFILSCVAFGQPANAALILSGETATGYESFTATLGLITQISIAIMFFAALVWFVWRGKSNEQLKEQVAGWKDATERSRVRIVELEAEKIRETAEIARLKLARIEDRKRILRLTAKVAGEEIEEIDDGY